MFSQTTSDSEGDHKPGAKTAENILLSYPVF